MIDVRVKYVSVMIANVDPGDFGGLAREAELLMKRKVPLVSGLIENIILGNDVKTQLLIVSQWESKEAWVHAQWDEDLGRTLADMVETSQSFEYREYTPIAIIRT